MRGRTAMALLLAGAAGVLAWYMTRKPKKESQTVRVAAAETNLLTFSVVKPHHIGPRDMHKSDFQAGVQFKWPSKEGKTDEEYETAEKELFDKICDRTVLYSMIEGDLIAEPKLAAKGAGQGLAALIPKDMRAVSLDLSSASSNVAGLIMPRNVVDIVATPKREGEKPKAILEFVEILAVDQWTHYDQSDEEDEGIKPQADKIKSVTVLLSQKDALTLEENKSGTITLLLRNPDDRPPIPDDIPDDTQDTQEEEDPSQQSQIVQNPVDTAPLIPAIPLPPPKPQVWMIRTLRNVQWGSIEVLESGTGADTPTVRGSTQSQRIVEANSESFALEVLDRSKQQLVVVLFWAEKYPGRGLLEPMLERMAEDYEGELSLVRIDVDQSRDIASRLGIQAVPSLVPYKDGLPIGQAKEGIESDKGLRAWLDELISPSSVEEGEVSEGDLKT